MLSYHQNVSPNRRELNVLNIDRQYTSCLFEYAIYCDYSDILSDVPRRSGGTVCSFGARVRDTTIPHNLHLNALPIEALTNADPFL